jgi:hypothetical protein
MRSMAAALVALTALAALAALAATAIALSPGRGVSVRGVTLPGISGRPARVVAHTLAYVKETSTGPPYVWAAEITGAHARKLGPGDQPTVSPDGTRVAATGVTGASVVIYPAAGGPARTFKTGGSAYGLVWSADSRYLAVNLASTALNGLTGAGIAVIDTTAGTVTLVAKGEPNGASFAVNGTDELVYGLAPSLSASAPVNLFEVAPTGTGTTQITHDGRSLNPVWGAKGIVFDRERLRGPSAYPADQLWLMSAAKLRQLTNLSISPLQSGLVPVAVSSNGNRLLAAYEGEDTNLAYTVQLSPLRVRAVPGFVQGGGISSDGSTLLIESGAFEAPPSSGTVETVPFGAARPLRKLARGASPSWNL